jgi:hypothetical protein
LFASIAFGPDSYPIDSFNNCNSFYYYWARSTSWTAQNNLLFNPLDAPRTLDLTTHLHILTAAALRSSHGVELRIQAQQKNYCVGASSVGLWRYSSPLATHHLFPPDPKHLTKPSPQSLSSKPPIWKA